MSAPRIKELPKVKHFASALARNVIAALIILTFSLGIGIAGYMYFFNLDWIDACYNASMILTGMGPVDKPPVASAKLFASGYAIYSGLAFLGSVAVVFAPVFHRFLHKFRLDVEE